MVMGVAVKVYNFATGEGIAGALVTIYRHYGYEQPPIAVAFLATDYRGIADFGEISPDGSYMAKVEYQSQEIVKMFTVKVASALVSVAISPPVPSRTIAARVPMFGNSAYVQKYLRKLRDRFLGKWHRRLHPII